jgi:hypothetical protein
MYRPVLICISDIFAEKGSLLSIYFVKKKKTTPKMPKMTLIVGEGDNSGVATTNDIKSTNDKICINGYIYVR